VSFHRAMYRKTAGLRMRLVPELSTCIVFTPAQPQLFNLNPHACLIMELAADQTHDGLVRNYLARVVPPLTELVARRQLEEGLQQLVDCGIIELAPAEPET
jgi:hypothetical protein